MPFLPWLSWTRLKGRNSWCMATRREAGAASTGERRERRSFTALLAFLSFASFRSKQNPSMFSGTRVQFGVSSHGLQRFGATEKGVERVARPCHEPPYSRERVSC